MTKIVRATAGNLEEKAAWKANESNGGGYLKSFQTRHRAHDGMRFR
jgi:hypothetical protein